MLFNFAEFKKRVTWKVIKQSGCWEITSHKLPENRDYPVISIFNVRYSAHRASYLAMHGSIGIGKIICHSCDNPRCINPNHLFEGTRKDNTQDMIKKNRESRWEGGRNCLGIDKRRKLTDGQIHSIKTSELSSYELAKIYPVSSVQIRRIRNGSRCAMAAQATTDMVDGEGLLIMVSST